MKWDLWLFSFPLSSSATSLSLTHTQTQRLGTLNYFLLEPLSSQFTAADSFGLKTVKQPLFFFFHRLILESVSLFCSIAGKWLLQDKDFLATISVAPSWRQ